MNFYENIFILSPNLEKSAIDNAVERVQNIVAQNGGEIIKTENWGQKKLAYDLKKQNKGIYVFVVFKSPAAVLSELERFYKVFDALLKYMFIKMDKKQVEALMASLKEKESEPQPSEEPAPEEAPEKTEPVKE